MLPDDAAGRAAAIEVLRGGGIVALPTDTVYGIAVAIDAPDGIERLFRAKDRPPEKGIALLLADAVQAWDLGVESASARRLAVAFWPGPLTLVLARRPGVDLPAALTGGAPTVGVRVPDHDAPRALARALGPLPTTSANRSGEPDALDAAAVAAALGDRVDLILDGGRTRGAAASTVVDCTREPVGILREGVLGEARIRETLG
ncbi:MAG: threonylcarbamoyl-AMP synthase [Chloroflexi bacterium]|nr:threonylcarbamoyl-AMP synthase [Chloroflexota bacterium]